MGNSLQLMNQPGLVASGVLVPQPSAEHVSIPSAPHLHFFLFLVMSALSMPRAANHFPTKLPERDSKCFALVQISPELCWDAFSKQRKEVWAK